MYPRFFFGFAGRDVFSPNSQPQESSNLSSLAIGLFPARFLSLLFRIFKPWSLSQGFLSKTFEKFLSLVFKRRKLDASLSQKILFCFVAAFFRPKTQHATSKKRGVD